VVLLGHPAVLDVAVFGIPDAIEGQRVAALIRLANDAHGDALEDIMSHARTSIADYKVPEIVRITHEIPRNALGKIDRKTLAGLLSNSQ
jgi:acyl-coenzyme A synthetase/AMP-(fatty) acid ligase